MAEILVVEDYPPMASLMTMMLRRQGHQVTCELTVAGALRHDRLFAYAVVDIDLPDGSGVALAEQLRRRVSSIVFFTATREATTLSSAAELGIVVNKAEGPNQVLYVIEQLEKRRGHSNCARQCDPLGDEFTNQAPARC
jgi:DNA-binding response OmpR family regulator